MTSIALALLDAFPDPDGLMLVEPEELAAWLLPLLQRRTENGGMFIPYNEENDLHVQIQYRPIYAGRYNDVSQVLSEAFAWMVAQGLAVPAEGSNGNNGWLRLSRKAKAMRGHPAFNDFATAQKLPKSLLHPKLKQTVWMAFARGEYDVAVFQAMKSVEVAVRDASGLSADLGVPLMRKAFDPNRGPLTDMDAEGGERESRSALFAGAIGSYKNPHSHRDVQLSDPGEATEIVMLANHLLRIVDGRVAARTGA